MTSWISVPGASTNVRSFVSCADAGDRSCSLSSSSLVHSGDEKLNVLWAPLMTAASAQPPSAQ